MANFDVNSVIQIVGSLLILVPFVLVQAKRLKATSVAYLVLNFVGSTVLAVDALLGSQWGFLLLEGVWAAVSLVGLLRVVTNRRPRARNEVI